MATMILDTINTPEGRSQIEEIIKIGINQHHNESIYFFANGMTARMRFNQIDGSRSGVMRFKPSEPASVWCQGE